MNDDEVSIYGVDSTGRPYAELEDLAIQTIAPRSSWSFSTLTHQGQVQDFVTYFDFD